MIESCLSWLCLISGLISSNPLWYIASACFAVAAYLSKIRNWKDGKQ